MSQQYVSLTIHNTTGYKIIFRNFYSLILTKDNFHKYNNTKNVKKNYFFLYPDIPKIDQISNKNTQIEDLDLPHRSIFQLTRKPCETVDY